MRLRSFVLVSACAGAASSFTAYMFRHYAPPFALVVFYVAACTIALSMRLNRGRALVYNSAFIFVTCGLVELYLGVRPFAAKYYEVTYRDVTEHRESDPAPLYALDSDLGYVILSKKHTIRHI